MPEKMCKKKHLTSFQLIILGFAGVIFLGSILLMLPVSSLDKVPTPFHEALFTATSAVCVTGLVVKDSGSYWSVFGQTVILALIQIGGLGVVTVAAAVSLLSGKKISLMQRSTMQDAISAPKVGGIVRLTRFILKGTLLIEAAGAMLLLPVFASDYGLKGIWMAAFHSVSAFCNAGFDILGTADNAFPSLTGYSGNILINVVIMLLIITGGIGFLTWDDIYRNKMNFKRYRMQSKIILMTTVCLIVFPAFFFFACDLKNLPAGERLLAAMFQSVTTRTAGFNTIDISEMSEASKAVMILLMLIGGSPGSTAGGMKTTTFTVLILNAIATFRSQENAGAFSLDNAMEASERLPEDQRLVTVKAERVRDMLIITVENNTLPGTRPAEGTTKKDRFVHGFGIPNIKKAVEKYDGQCSFHQGDGTYLLKILIPIP